MTDTLTLLLAGQNSITKVDFLKEALETDWRFDLWNPDDDRDGLVKLLPTADAVVGGNIVGGWPSAARLKLYQIPFAGYNWISPGDIPAGVTFCNTYEHEIPIAEYVLASMLDWEMGYCKTTADFKQVGWDGIGAGQGPVHSEVYGKTVGIVGYGRIGQEVARRADAFGMRVIGIARSTRQTPAPLDWLGTMSDVDQLLAESDYVLIACPQNDETLGMINSGRFKAMKPDGVIINVARGPIIDEKSLYDALATRQIGGAIIDVWYDYPEKGKPVDRPSRYDFHNLKNIRMSPHVSGWTSALIERRWTFVARNLDRFARGEPLQNIVFEGTGPV